MFDRMKWARDLIMEGAWKPTLHWLVSPLRCLAFDCLYCRTKSSAVPSMLLYKQFSSAFIITRKPVWFPALKCNNCSHFNMCFTPLDWQRGALWVFQWKWCTYNTVWFCSHGSNHNHWRISWGLSLSNRMRFLWGLLRAMLDVDSQVCNSVWCSPSTARRCGCLLRCRALCHRAVRPLSSLSLGGRRDDSNTCSFCLPLMLPPWCWYSSIQGREMPS